MKKIDLIELMDENNTKPKDQGETWVDVLENIKRESNNFDLETMCNICIKQQYELGIKDKDGNLITPIECTGLQTFKNKIETEHSSEVYDEIKEMLSAEELSLAEQTVNSMTWMEHTIKDEKLFSPRPYQILINSCSAKKKVLRMGRRCLEENEKVVGVKKSYRAKHLWHLFKNYKKMPEIVSYDDETGELVRTDQYLIMPNGIELVYKVTTETGHTTSATLKHPLFVFSKSGKQFEYKEIGDIDIENDQILFLDNKLHNIKSITKVGMRQTYHISVVKYETFATGAGFLHHNTGKALDVRTPIPTPNGWKTMGDIQIGDKVFDDNGEECNVTFVTQHQHERECFEITFDNGDTIIADAEHQWAVSLREHRRKSLLEGKSIADSELVLQTKDLLDYKDKHYAIRLTDPVQYSEKDLTVDPYVLGYWLGDGNANTTILTIGDQDKSETLERVKGYGYSIKEYKQKYTYKLENVYEDFKKLTVLNNKHIPTNYLQGSVEQRLELLRGILDSDGSYSERDDTIEYTSSDELLANNVQELLSSLGIKTSVRKNKSVLKGVCHKDRYRLVFKTHLKVFNLKRKDLNSKVKTNTRSSYLYIKSINPVESRPVKCISVDSERSLYLATKNYIVTHNTFAMSVGLLHRLLVNKGYRVLMVAPMETMITEVVEQIKKFCAAMEEDPIVAATQSPIHQLTFNTGSTFKGVTAGASGAKGTRGKGADLLYVDECLPAKTKIKLHDGSVKNIEEIEVGDKVLSFDEKKGKLVSKPVVAVKCTGKKEVFSFTTVSGKKIHCTAEHPVLTRSGWMAAHEANSIATTETRSGEYFFESIIGCKLKSIEPVYNLEVKDTHTYIADGFIVHNCDFLRPKDLNSILGILMDSKNTEFWASSTPIGETNLYKLSQDPSFKEFHYPSFVIPHYSDEMDAVLRAQMDEAGYIQEVCLDGETLIKTPKGLKKIKEITTLDKVYDKNGVVSAIWQNPRVTGIKDVFRYTVSDGSCVECTSDHKFPDELGNKEEIGSLKYLQKKFNRRNYSVNREEIYARLIGYSLGDGTIPSTRLSSHFYANSSISLEPLLTDIKELYPNFNGKIRVDTTGGNENTSALCTKVLPRATVECSVNITKDLIEKGAVRGKKVYQDFDIPDFVKKGTKGVKSNFIGALFGAEGCISVESNGILKQPTLTMTKRSKKDGFVFFNSLVDLLKDFGIVSTYSISEVVVPSKLNRPSYTSFNFVLRISSDLPNLKTFLTDIPISYCYEKELKAERVLQYIRDYEFLVKKAKEDSTLVRELVKNGKPSREVQLLLNLSKSTVEKYRNNITPTRVPSRFGFENCFNYLEVCLDGYIAFFITDREHLGKREVYNLGVSTEDTSYLLGNDILTFNCAEFGADNDSVYPINFIEQAIVREEVIINAEYVSRNRRDFIVVMGVDWNHDKVGTRIVILAYHKLSGRYFTIVKEKVSKANWTQILAVEKIVDLNRMYEIDHIYVDEGFGITQASQLRLFSQSQYGKVPPNHPDLKLSKVVSVNFSASITLRDPISGDEYRKQTKQYMIEHSVDLLTRGLIVLQEKEDADIIAQMKNYVIKTKTVSGLKTYTYRDAQIADHDLDAFNIALHGFHTEYSEFVSTSPLVGLNTILKEGASLPDESSIISYGSNMIINTKKSLITSKFRQDRSNREFKTRKRW